MKVTVAVALLMSVALRARAADAPLREVQRIPLPDVAKRIDHLAIDVPGNRLFVAALGNGTLEVVDLATGRRVRSVRGLDEPQGVAYVAAVNRVIVANRGGGVVAFDATTFARVGAMAKLPDADNLRFDERTKQLWVGYGDGALAAFDPATMQRSANIALPAHPESFRLATTGPLAFVNLPDVKMIAVVDRDKRTVVRKVPLPTLLGNFPMSLDERRHRIFVGAREPARLVVIDGDAAHVVADVPCVGDADDLFVDEAADRIYVIGGEGFVDVFDAKDPTRYGRLARLPTAPGARTGLWVPELRRLYVAAPPRDGHEAAIHVLEAPGAR
jgi:hypothetical protein